MIGTNYSNAIGMYVTVFMYQLLRSCVCGAKDKYIYWVIFGIDMLSKSTSKFFKSRRWVKVLGMRLNFNWGNPHNYFRWIFTILVANHHTWILILRSSILHAWQVLYQNTTVMLHASNCKEHSATSYHTTTTDRIHTSHSIYESNDTGNDMYRKWHK